MNVTVSCNVLSRWAQLVSLFSTTDSDIQISKNGLQLKRKLHHLWRTAMWLSHDCSWILTTACFSGENVSLWAGVRSSSLGDNFWKSLHLLQPCYCSVIPTLWSGKTMVSVLHANLISCRRVGFLLAVAATSKSNSSYLFYSSYLFCKLWLCQVLIADGAFLTDVDRFPWKSQSEFCIVRATY